MEKTRKPGTRQFECVRRAWHSDRHQPMRGSIIQQIFRIVNETHGSATRKNREWQEKLPIVVLKVEEIMYSKAHSEAEYMNQDTLWDRLNDAVDTIIRRDENIETGQLLQPCIEAALVLGCVPVRASRSQRCNMSYLTPRAQDLPPVTSVALAAPIASDNVNNLRLNPTPQPCPPPCHQISMPRPAVVNQPNFAPKSDGPWPSHINHMAAHNAPSLRSDILPGIVTSVPYESSSQMSFGSIYHLYCGTHIRRQELQFGFRLQQHSNADSVIIGTPVGWSQGEPAHVTKNLFPSDYAPNAGDKLRQGKSEEDRAKTSEIVCDLSLRLGPSSSTRSLSNENVHGDISRCNEGRELLDSSSRK